MRHFCTPRFASLAVAGLALFLASALFVLPSAFAAETQALARKTRTKTKTKTTLVPGNTIHVPADQPTIQAGINAASNGDTVLVSPGTYTENIDFMGKQITVTSVSGPAVTIIDGGGYNTNFSATVNFSTNETANSILSGFTIQDGQSSDIFITNAAPTIQGNVIQGSSFLGNCYNNGYCEDGIDLWQGAAALIQGNLIVINGQEGVSTNGDSGTQVLGNIIAYSGDAGVQFGNAGGTELIQQNSIFGNYNGGIVYGSYSSTGSASIIQNLVYANLGPGVQWQSAPFALISNTIANNGPGQFNNCCSLATEAAGTITNQVTIQNNLIVADQSLPAFDCYYLPPAAAWTNNDVFAANNTAYTSECADPTGTNGNLALDPQFVDLLSSNFHIQSTSPAVKAGTISAPNEPAQDFDGDPRELNGAIDIGADEYNSPTSLTVSSYFLRFGNQGVGSISTPQIVTLTNNGSSPVTINLIATGQNFIQTNNCGSSLASQSNCQINVSFAPIYGGPLNSVLGIFTSATLNPQAIGLAGNAIPAAISINPYGLQWYNLIIGTSSTQTMTITNPGSTPLSITSIVYTGAADFLETNNCPLAPNTLAQNAFCTVTVTYTPTVTGNESGNVLVTDNADGQDNLWVYGNAFSAGIATLSPSSLTFPTTVIGQSSAPQTVTLSNTGTGTLGKINIYASYSDFPISNNTCPTSLAPGANCTFAIAFAPFYQGTDSGYVSVYDDATQYPTSMTLTGSGTAAVPTITSLSFSSAPSGSPDTQIIINGTGFLYGYNNTGTQALWNGTVISTYQYVSGTTQIYFTIPAYLLTTDGVNQITVTTPAPGGGTSNSMPFTVYTPLNYVARTSTYTYTTITGTNLNLVWTYNGASAQITSPFAIQFGGGSFTTLTVASSGTISFSAYTSEWNSPIPNSYVPTLVAPFWDQLYPFGTGTDNNVFWEVLGTAPNRQLVIEWRDVGYCCESTNTIKFQVVFLEGSGNFYFNYANTSFGKTYRSNNGATASVGEQVSAILGTQFSYYKPLLKSKSSILWQPSNPSATLSTSTVGFGYQQIGGPATPQSFTLTNGGPQSLSITSVTVSNPDFTQSNNCPATLTLGKSCKFTVTFKPSLPSAETATLTINDNATNSPQIVTMTGIGTVTSTLVYPGLVNFGSVKVGTTSTLPVILANASNKAMTIQSITVTPSAYTVSSNCGTSLAPSLSCTVNVTFAPTSTGNVSGSLSMGLNGAKSKAESKLSGSGS